MEETWTNEAAGRRVRIRAAEYAPNPGTEGEPIGTFLQLPDSRYKLAETPCGADEFLRRRQQAEAAGDVVVNVFLHEHGAVTLSTAERFDQWDTRLFGAVIVPEVE